MRSRHERETIVMVKRLGDILAERVSCASRRYTPATGEHQPTGPSGKKLPTIGRLGLTIEDRTSGLRAALLGHDR